MMRVTVPVGHWSTGNKATVEADTLPELKAALAAVGFRLLLPNDCGLGDSAIGVEDLNASQDLKGHLSYDSD